MITPVTARRERQGVMEVTLEPSAMRGSSRSWRPPGVLLGYVVTAGDLWTDEFHFARRRRAMTLAAEIQWSLLPLAAFACQEISVAGALEPAYEVGGDAFDYACGRPGAHPRDLRLDGSRPHRRPSVVALRRDLPQRAPGGSLDRGAG